MNESDTTAVPRGRTILAASTVISNQRGAFLLIRRKNEPGAGQWSVPGGTVEPGETLREAAAREALEETGLHVRVGRELWNLTVPTGTGDFYEIHDFWATVESGTLVAGDDAVDVGWFTHEQMSGMTLTDDLLSYFERAGLI
jgi:8-oxo-dGTP diphosphatase